MDEMFSSSLLNWNFNNFLSVISQMNYSINNWSFKRWWWSTCWS